tara:strand:- start:1363 stop:1836 length:474 start_codon:yes stop_codon:yes gene_type:complete
MKKNSKGFTLIELLVVVAIIGILAAVGVVAYNGYTTSAKKGSSKTIHSQTVKFLAAESKKCELGESTFFASLSCTGVTRDLIHANIKTNVATIFTDKNPHSTGSNAVTTNDGNDIASAAAGNTVISKSATAGMLSVSTCTASGCATADILTTKVGVQ